MSTTEKMRESELLDKLICDYGPSKYLDIVWAMEWARCLRGREEYRQLTMAEMIEKAMLEVISGQIGSEHILGTIYGSPSPAKAVAEAAADKKDEKKGEKKTAKKAEKAEEQEEPKKAKKEKTKKD